MIFSPRLSRRKMLGGLLSGYAAISGLVKGAPLTFAAELGASGQGMRSKGRPLTLLVLGDSLTAGYGLPLSESFPSQLEAALQQRGHAIRVINAGVSGDTTADGLARLDWVLGEPFDAAIVELGANDALRGLPPTLAQENLRQILTRLRQPSRPILLAGMMAPRNLGADYGRAFDALYPALAKEFSCRLYPFFLEGVIGGPTGLLQSDGLHPTKAGVARIVTGILPEVEALLQDLPRVSQE